jgi:hypothetical protein
MSSHHFVREEQEPALVIFDSGMASLETIQQLLEWSPTVVVWEEVIEEVLSWGIKIDVVIAAGSNAERWKGTLQEQAPVKILSCENKTDAVATALYFLIASKQKAVNVLSNQPLTEFATYASLDICVFQNGLRWSHIRSGHFEKWLPAGSKLVTSPPNELNPHVIASDGIQEISRDTDFWVAEV